MPTPRSPAATRRPSPSTTKKAADPVPSPRTMPSSTSSIARIAAARFSSSRLGVMLGSRCLIDEPDELADRVYASGRQGPIPRQSPRQRLPFVRAGHEKSRMPAALERRIGQGDAGLRPAADNFGNPPMPLFEHARPRNERCRVPVWPQPEDLDIEQRSGGIEAFRTIIGFQYALIHGGGIRRRAGRG